jgi:hypothetical protein
MRHLRALSLSLTLWLVAGLLMPTVSPVTASSPAAPYAGVSAGTRANADAGANAGMPETAFAHPQFQQVWARADLPVALGQVARSWLWGPQPGEVRAEPFAGAPGNTRTVQYFDKARMEVNHAVTDPSSPWAITTGLLVVELVSGRVQVGPDKYETRTPADVPVAGDAVGRPDLDTAPRYSSFSGVASMPGGPARRVPPAIGAPVVATIDRGGRVGTLPTSNVVNAAYSPQTGHNIPDVFVRFMQARGPVSEKGVLQEGPLFDPVYLLGFPITEAYWTTVPIGGKPTQVLVQLYQRRVLTYVPGFDPAWQVQMGNVGRHYFQWRYGRAWYAAGEGDTFVRVVGDRLYYAGKPVVLKGTNYWYSKHPFVGTWVRWDGPFIKEELDKARQLGVNVVRIGIPYDHGRAMSVVWGKGCRDDGPRCYKVQGPIVNMMTQFLQIASSYNMKVLFTLFEWSDSFPPDNTDEFKYQRYYLQGIITPFAEDDRVLGWDLHNEPEYYYTWAQPGGSKKVVDWVSNIAAEVRKLDKQHPITVGVGQPDTLWVQGSQGQRIVDVVDFVSFHSYDAGGLRTQIDAIKARTTKPVVLEEMGWPTGPAQLSSPRATYDEATQLFLYRTMLADARAAGLAGVIQWTLWDNPPGDPKTTKPSVEPWFGLVRLDGTFKPAAAEFRGAYPAQPLPSRTTTNVPLTHFARDKDP